MTLGKRKYTGILKKKHGIALSGKLALEEARGAVVTQTTKWINLNSYDFINHSSTLKTVHLTLVNWHNWLCNVAAIQCLESKIFPKDSWAVVHLLKECVTRHKKSWQDVLCAARFCAEAKKGNGTSCPPVLSFIHRRSFFSVDSSYIFTWQDGRQLFI